MRNTLDSRSTVTVQVHYYLIGIVEFVEEKAAGLDFFVCFTPESNVMSVDLSIGNSKSCGSEILHGVDMAGRPYEEFF